MTPPFMNTDYSSEVGTIKDYRKEALFCALGGEHARRRAQKQPCQGHLLPPRGGGTSVYSYHRYSGRASFSSPIILSHFRSSSRPTAMSKTGRRPGRTGIHAEYDFYYPVVTDAPSISTHPCVGQSAEPAVRRCGLQEGTLILGGNCEDCLG
ncbi:hypothetical protein KM043_002652 [Ampulex compressa]|nr:hypothetical protein KM043_002652 [Ampulex compressa]